MSRQKLTCTIILTNLRLRLWSLTGSRSGRLGSSSGTALNDQKALLKGRAVDPDWIRIQWHFYGFGSIFGIRMPNLDPGAIKWRKQVFFFNFYNLKVRNTTDYGTIYDFNFVFEKVMLWIWIRICLGSGFNDFVDPDPYPDWAEMLHPDPDWSPSKFFFTRWNRCRTSMDRFRNSGGLTVVLTF
jgi:hypothetical protein